MKPVIGITVGDFNGIGPEVALKSVLTPSVRRICSPLLVGSIEVFEFYARRLGIHVLLKETVQPLRRLPGGTVQVIEPTKYQRPRITPGVFSREAGNYAGRAIKKAVDLCLDGTTAAMVTAPVSKEAMYTAGFRFVGQTEMLAKRCRSSRVAMMLIANGFRVGLATVHVPVRSISRNLSRQLLREKLDILHHSLRRDFRISSPRIAVLGLNPHAGENGLLGKEEQEVIQPVVDEAQKKKFRVMGPFPADGFFGMHAFRQYDAVLAMYHDQGLIPLKMSGFNIGVNFSAGLPIVRTSPDHGTAFDIAGKGMANPQSMIEAIKLAVAIAHNRRRSSSR